ncbi:transcription elongation factor spt5 [Steccherinum ochraceum]|uniref:Transcription elongation factor SPT5 n=1 Tax=Steccherinum ochraceum TaxID=92696 RepID=A0A4R0RAP2_9APHY|nr:transcription elongation factor spt5 [Steccherinum ochraceum]
MDEEDMRDTGGYREEEEEEEEQEEQVPRPSKKERRRRDYDEEEEEEGEEEEEEDDEEEEEDVGAERGRKRPKHRHKRPAVNRFLDVEAEVDEDEEEDDDDEEYGKDEFIADIPGEGDDDDVARRAADHARLDRRERELNDQDLAKIAADVSERYRRTAVRYSGDMNEIPQRLLMPSVHDANLWQVRVRPGKERDLVFSLMRKAIDLEFSARPLQILSAFQRDTLPGMIYVEARSAKQVSDACQGLVGIYPSRGIILVPIEEMASLLQIKKQDLTVTPNSWVRIRRGKYQGDLAQVMDVTENGEEVGLKFIPRIDLNPRDENSVDGKKRKKIGAGLSSFSMRPPQRFFNYEEVAKVYGRKTVAKRNQVYVFQNDTYKDGFIEKDFKITALQLDNVNPTLDEITQFTRGQDGTENEASVDLSIIAEASRKAAISVLQPGDHVEVFEGEQSGVHGTVHSIEQDVVTILPVGVEFDGQRVQIPARSVRKRFKPGDHVKVMTGQNADETGLVVSVVDNVVTFLSDMSLQEVSVFSKDLREAAEVGTGTNIVGNYELHDLVQLDQQTVGVIFKTDRDSFRVLDQNGHVRSVQPHQISMRRDSHRAIAADSEGHELRSGDNVKEADGEGRKGRVLHTHQSFFAFLHNRDIAENGGVFVTRARSLVSQAPKGNILKLGSTDLSKMNPSAAGGGMAGSGTGRGPRDRHIGMSVVIVKGPRKGYVGIIKDTNGTIARVELLTGQKVVSVDKKNLRRKNIDGTIEPLPALGGMGPPGSFNRTANPYQNTAPGAPGWGRTGRTPNPYALQDGKTPAWNAGKTPNPYATDSSKTPAWNTSARTPNPYAQDGGKTPAWSASSRTPNPYAGGAGTSNWGGATPLRPSWGGATPGRSSDPSTSWGDSSRTTTGWGSPPRNESDPWGTGQESLGAPTPAWGAPTPAAFPRTPAAYAAPTPTPYGAPTPAPYGAPTPYYETPRDAFRQDGGAIPQTPGADFGPLDDEVPEKWLLDPIVSSKKGILAEIKRTSDGRDWQEGKYDGEKVVIRSVLDTRDSNFQSTAEVQFLNSQVPFDKPVIPVDFLYPVEPERTGDTVLVLEDGPRKGDEGKVREADPDSNTCAVSIVGTHLIVEIRRRMLVKLQS